MQKPAFVRWDGFEEHRQEQIEACSQAFFRAMQKRRSIRNFSDRSVPDTVIKHCIAAAGTAPSGANKQPWHFVVVRNAQRKQAIREASEQCEQAFYRKIQGTQWADSLEPLGVGVDKPLLTEAPYLVVVFAQRHGLDSDGSIEKHYYVSESVGIAVGFFLAAVHQAHLASLVYTPAPMTFLNDLLDRPSHERAVCICPVGYPAEQVMVPNQSRKSVEEITTWL